MRETTHTIDPETFDPIPFDIFLEAPAPIPAHDLGLDDILTAIQELEADDWSDFGLDREADYPAGSSQESLGLVPGDWLARSGSTTASPLPSLSFCSEGILAAITGFTDRMTAFSDSLGDGH